MYNITGFLRSKQPCTADSQYFRGNPVNANFIRAHHSKYFPLSQLSVKHTDLSRLHSVLTWLALTGSFTCLWFSLTSGLFLRRTMGFLSPRLCLVLLLPVVFRSLGHNLIYMGRRERKMTFCRIKLDTDTLKSAGFKWTPLGQYGAVQTSTSWVWTIPPKIQPVEADPWW